MGRLLIIPLGLLVLLMAALVWSGGGTEKPADFRFINRGDIMSLDPNKMSYLQDIRMAYAMWEGLYTYHPETLVPIPGTAERVDLSPDARVYTFHIRRDARWSNGDPVTAHDFVFAWRRMLEQPGPYTYLLYYIQGAEPYVLAYQANEPTDFGSVGIRAVEDHTLRVELTDPVAFFLDLVAFPPFLPLHAPSMDRFKQVDAATGRVTYDQRFTRPPHVVTNGPFVLTQWDFKRRLRLEKNEHYWDRANVKSDTIEMVVVDDQLTRLLRYESGAVDWVAEISSEIAADLKEQGRSDLRAFGGFGTAYLSLNTLPEVAGRKNPLADERVRQAFAMAIDRQQIVESITRMGEKPATTFIPPGVFEGYEFAPGIDYDPERARQLLAEAGYPGGQGFAGVTMLFRTDSSGSKDLAQNIRNQLKQRLNIDIPLEGMEAQIVRNRVNEHNYTMCAANWIGDYGDPSTFTDKYRSTSENNDSVWKNPEYDRLVNEAAREIDPVKRMDLLEAAERLLNTQVPIVPLYHLTNQYLFRDNVKGINLSPRNMNMFKAIEVVRE